MQRYNYMVEDTQKDISTLWIWWKRYGEHFTAPLILIALIILGYGLYQDNRLQEEINLSCGWGEEDYKCVCTKSAYQQYYDGLNNSFLDSLNFTDPNSSNPSP